MKIYIPILFVTLLVSPCCAQTRTLYGSTIYNGVQIKAKHPNWTFFACCEMVFKALRSQCVWATEYLNYGYSPRDTARLVSCCQEKFKGKNLRCIEDKVSDARALSFLNFDKLTQEELSFFPLYNISPNKTKQFFTPGKPFTGPYILFNQNDQQCYALYGVEYSTNNFGDKTISFYVFDPFSARQTMFSYPESYASGLVAFYPSI